MQSTVSSALPLETAIRDYLDSNDLIGPKSFLATRRPPNIADVLERLPGRQSTVVLEQL